MKLRIQIPLLIVALLIVAGCAKTTVTDRDQVVTGKLPRPETIWVHDFAATPGDLPIHSSLDRDYYARNNPPQTPEQIAEGRKLGTEIATELVKLIRETGLNADLSAMGATPRINDIIIEGYLLSYKEGSEDKRVLIGLGAGGSDLKVAVEGFQQTAEGPRLLGSGDTDSKSGKTPGAGVGLASMLITHNPVGLILSSGVKVYEEESGGAKVSGRAEQTAKEIADQLKNRFKEEGWIE